MCNFSVYVELVDMWIMPNKYPLLVFGFKIKQGEVSRKSAIRFKLETNPDDE